MGVLAFAVLLQILNTATTRTWINAATDSADSSSSSASTSGFREGVGSRRRRLPAPGDCPRWPSGRGSRLARGPLGERISIATLRAAGLTAREAEVLRLVALGHPNSKIADQLTVSPRTVQKHMQNILEKLGARSRTQAVATAWSIARTGGRATPVSR